MEILEGPCFIAHTHSPGIINSLFKFESAKNYEDTFWKITKEPSLINVGSVGQPRDNDPRACYVVVEDGSLKYRRVEYDTEKTAEKIRAIKALDNRLADRLIVGS
jgi:diadenosine tetraphosphatase ApaH/serine/threonine PP2A family protein phosphatase